jgi:hypothetical protein
VEHGLALKARGARETIAQMRSLGADVEESLLGLWKPGAAAAAPMSCCALPPFGMLLPNIECGGGVDA